MPINEEVVIRNNVKIIGSGDQVILFANGFGCNQVMWRFLIPELGDNYKIVVFDYVGSVASNLGAYSKQKYETLAGYAQDIIDICIALDLSNVVLVGHSVSGMISLLAAQRIPSRIGRMVMICPSPCFLNLPPDYLGGFDREDLNQLMDLMDKNYIGWAQYLAPLVTGQVDNHLITGEIIDGFCSTNPVTAKGFAKATFYSDSRSLLPLNRHPVLLLQSENDPLASLSIGNYLEQHTPHSILTVIPAKGHCLHMTNPDKVGHALSNFIRSPQQF